MNKIRILLADDHTIMRAGLRLLLERQPDLEVVGETEDGRQAVRAVDSENPDVVVMDIAMPNLNGIEATRQIAGNHPNIAVVILSMHSDESYVLRALKAGARAYLLKDSAEADLIRAVRTLATAAGVPWFSSSSLRYSNVVATLKSPDAQAVFTWGPGPLEEHHHLDLSWYAIHPIEMLYALLGSGCEEVTRVYTADGDIITGKWSGGRTGTVRTLRPYGGYGGVVFRPNQVVLQSPPLQSVGYHELVAEIVKFLSTGKPPVPHEETLEIFAFMDAALRSMRDGGKPVKLPTIR